MPMMTGKEYIESLRALNPEIYFFDAELLTDRNYFQNI